MNLPSTLSVRTITPLGPMAWVEGTFAPVSRFVTPPDVVRLAVPLDRVSVDAPGLLELLDDDDLGVPDFAHTLDDAQAPLTYPSMVGSDTWGGGLWFGTEAAMKPVIDQLDVQVRARLRTAPAVDYFGLGEWPLWYAWSFPDGTQLVLLYTGDMALLDAVAPPGVIHTLFGSASNDETLMQCVTSMTSALLVPLGGLDADPALLPAFSTSAFRTDDADSMLSVQGHPVGAQDHGLFLILAQRLLLDVLKLDQYVAFDDPLGNTVAMALRRWAHRPA